MSACIICEKSKPIEEMGVRKKNTCKRCMNLARHKRSNAKPERKEYNKAHTKKRLEEGYFRDWYKRNPENSKIRTKRSVEFRKNNPDKIKRYLKEQKDKNPEKFKAGHILRNAVFRKKIVKPNTCEKCMMQKDRIEAHHEDYSKPLEVVWLCVSCHKKMHRKEV